MADKTFADGLRFERNAKAPGYVVGSLSVKVPDFIAFLQKHQNNAGYVSIDIKLSQKGSYYCELYNYTPPAKVEVEAQNQAKLNSMSTVEYPEDEINPEDIPF